MCNPGVLHQSRDEFRASCNWRPGSVKLSVSKKARPTGGQLLNHCNSDNYLLPNKGKIVG
jgi:hypothetical protein